MRSTSYSEMRTARAIVTSGLALLLFLTGLSAAQNAASPSVPEELFGVVWVPTKEAVGNFRVYRPASNALGTLASMEGRGGFEMMRDGSIRIYPPLEDFGGSVEIGVSGQPVIRHWQLSGNRIEVRLDGTPDRTLSSEIVSLEKDRLVLTPTATSFPVRVPASRGAPSPSQ